MLIAFLVSSRKLHLGLHELKGPPEPIDRLDFFTTKKAEAPSTLDSPTALLESSVE